MSEHYDDFDRALLRAGKRAAAPTSRMRARALGAAAGAGAATAAATKAAAATKVGALAKMTKVVLAAKWTVAVAVTTASVGTAVYVVEARSEKERALPVVVAAAPPAISTPAAPAAPAAPPPEPSPVIVEPEPVVTKAPKPVIVAKTPAVDPLREELGLVEGARRALAAGDASGALRQVDEHAQRFPSGAFAVERDVLRIDALAAVGRRDEAAVRARDFLARHPGSAQARRIATMTETNP